MGNRLKPGLVRAGFGRVLVDLISPQQLDVQRRRARSMGPLVVAAGFAAVLLASCSPKAEASLGAQDLIRRYWAENEICRGGGVPEKEMWAACNRRGEISHALFDKGWCFGEDAKSTADALWQPCKSAEQEYSSAEVAEGNIFEMTELPPYQGGEPASETEASTQSEWSLVRTRHYQEYTLPLTAGGSVSGETFEAKIMCKPAGRNTEAGLWALQELTVIDSQDGITTFAAVKDGKPAQLDLVMEEKLRLPAFLMLDGEFIVQCEQPVAYP